MSIAAYAPTSLPTTSSAQRITGYILTGLSSAFLLMDAIMKLMRLPVVVAGTKQVGYSESAIVPLGVILAVCVAIYLIPRTSVFGAILLTGYLGGAVATHVRMGNPLFTHILSPTYFAAALWLGLWLRDARLRAITPIRRNA